MAKKSFWLQYKLTWSWSLVLLWVLFVDFAWHCFNAPVNEYTNGLLVKAIWMLVFSVMYMLIYEQAARSWRTTSTSDKKEPNPDNKGIPQENKSTKMTFSEFKSSVLFSIFTSFVIIAVIAWSAYVISVIYLYVLAGIRGEIPEDGLKDAVLVTQVVGSGLILELCGKDETDSGREGI